MMMNNNKKNKNNSISFVSSSPLDVNKGGGGGCLFNNSGNNISPPSHSSTFSKSSSSRFCDIGGSGSGNMMWNRQRQSEGGGGITGNNNNNNNGPTNQIDAMMAKELNDLSLEQRNKVYEEIHGVADYVNEEDINFVNRCLELLDEEINKIRKRQAYDRALFLNPRYVKSKKFRLMFLRSTKFDPFTAAKKIINHFKYKQELFGIDKVAKQYITLDDLNDDDIDAITKSGVQFISQPDKSGRTIMFFSHTHVYFKDAMNHLRARWYQTMVALEDERTQQKGIVTVMYGKPDLSYGDLSSKIHMLRDGLPFRWVSLHFCFNDKKLYTFMTLLLTVWGKEIRSRFRPHCGSSMECLYSLNTYGISDGMIPLDCDGNYDRIQLQQYIKQRQQIENDRQKNKILQDDDDNVDNNNTNTNTIIEIPNNNDVLLGRGRPYQDYTGNLQLREIISKRYNEYKSANQTKKTIINKEIVKQIKIQYNGRFLKRNDKDQWIQVDDAKARLKVSHCFRNCTTSTTSNNNDKNDDSTTTTTTTKRQKTQ